MTKREKRLKKGIESLGTQRKIHEHKREWAKKFGKLELESYYDKEIKGIDKRIKDRKSKLERK